MGEYGFSSLLKQKIKTKNKKICFVIYSAGIFFLKFLCYEVFAKQKRKLCAANYYSGGYNHMLQHSLMNESARANLRCACLLMHTDSQRHFRRKYRWRKYRCLGSPTETVAIVCLRRRLTLSLDSSKFSKVLSRWVSEYASWLKIGILNSISPAL